ncbi:MAG: hypothetical protein RLZ71_320 [Actinomycetota bacterium]|jgi:hypothetical protein
MMLRRFLVLLVSLPLAFGSASSASAVDPLQITFETGDTSGYINIDFDDQGAGRQASSVVSGIAGNSGKVLQVVRGLASWAGTTILKAPGKALVSSGAMYVTAKINAPVAGKKLLMKLENMSDVTQSVESYSTQDSVVGWHEYTFDFSVQRTGTEAFSANKTYNMASVFFDFTLSPNPSTSGLTYYLDDVTFASATAGGGGGGGNTPVATPTLLTYEANDTLGALGASEALPNHPEGIFGGGTGAIVNDTVGMGVAGNKVFQLTKSGQPWTGYNAIVDLSGIKRITNAASPNVTFKYYSPKASSPVAIQLFVGDTMDTQMIQTANLGLNRMSFNLSTVGTWSASKIYTKLVIFPDFQVATSTPAAVYYFDDVAINGAVTPAFGTKPSNRVAPSISNKTFKIGTTLSSLRGTWLGSGSVAYKYTWYRCVSAAKAAKCSVIAGQRTAKYKLAKADKGKYVRLQVTAANTVGSFSVFTKSTGKVG